MSYSRRQLEAFGEPFGSCATRVKPGGYGRIYGIGNEPAPEGSVPSEESDYYYQTGSMAGPGQFMVANPEYGGPAYVPYTGVGAPSKNSDYYHQTGSTAGAEQFMVANPEYAGPAYVPYTGVGVPSKDSDYYYQTGSMAGPGQYMVANPAYKVAGSAYIPFTSTAATENQPTPANTTSIGGGSAATSGVTPTEIDLAYSAILGRPADPFGKAHYLNSGLSIQDIQNQLAASGEGQAYEAKVNAAATLANTARAGSGATTNTGGGGGTATTTGGGGGSNWINAGGATLFEGNTDAIRDYIKNLYTTELKRDADTKGLDWWTSQIAADGKVSQDELNAWRAGATRAGETLVNVTQDEAARRAAEDAARRAAEDAARAGQGTATNQNTNVNRPGGFLGAPFTGGQEYNPFYAGPYAARSDLVNMAYQRLLNRQPDPGGLASYSQEMTRGLTGQGLVSRLTSSPEFQRTQDFQRAYTSTFRPGYQEFGPSGQYNQPIYLSSYTNYARSPEFAQPLYNTTMMTPQDVGYGFGSFNPFAYGGTNEFASANTAPASSSTAGGSTAAARGGRIKDDEGIAALLPR